MLAHACQVWQATTMANSSMGGIARARSLTPAARTRIARKAALARWSATGRRILSIPHIKRVVKGALEGRDAKAFLFGSYASRKATPKSDVDLMVVLASPDADWFDETAVINGRLDFGKPIDLIVMDEATYERWKGKEGSIPCEVARTGVRLV